MFKVIIDKEDLKNQIDYLRSLDRKGHFNQQVVSRQIKQLHWIKGNSSKLDFDDSKIMISRKILENKMQFIQVYIENTKDINSKILNKHKIDQIDWVLKHSDIVWDEVSIPEPKKIITKWDWMKFEFVPIDEKI